MSSYFVVAAPPGDIAVHDRSRCPPAWFREGPGIEYLGEFLEPAQALAVARLRYAHAHGCACCDPAPAPAARFAAGVQAPAHPLNPS
jgi:hypothetical protein